MKKIKIHQIDAFTSRPFGGNPAAVALTDELSASEMAQIAAEMNLSETAFLSSSDSADYKLRWFTPSVEVDLCGHATIASLHYLKETGKLEPAHTVTFETRSGILKCYTENNWYYMQIPGMGMRSFDKSIELLLNVIGIDKADAGSDPMLLDNGYLYIPVGKIESLGKLKPDFKALRKLSDTLPFSAVAVFSMETIEEASTAHLRFFAPFYGIDEDPVTGSANGPLLNVLEQTGRIKYSEGTELIFEQGDFLGRPGRVRVSRTKNDVYIAGEAYTVLNGELVF